MWKFGLLLCCIVCLVGCGPPVGYTRVMGRTVMSYGNYGVVTLRNNIDGTMITNIVMRTSGQRCSFEEARNIEIWPAQDTTIPVIRNYWGRRARIELTGDVYRAENRDRETRRPIGYIRETFWVSEQSYSGSYGYSDGFGSSDSGFVSVDRFYPLVSIDRAATRGSALWNW